MTTSIEWFCPTCGAKRGFSDYYSLDNMLDLLRTCVTKHTSNEHPEQDIPETFEARLMGSVI